MASRRRCDKPPQLQAAAAVVATIATCLLSIIIAITRLVIPTLDADK